MSLTIRPDQHITTPSLRPVSADATDQQFARVLEAHSHQPQATIPQSTSPQAHVAGSGSSQASLRGKAVSQASGESAGSHEDAGASPNKGVANHGYRVKPAGRQSEEHGHDRNSSDDDLKSEKSKAHGKAKNTPQGRWKSGDKHATDQRVDSKHNNEVPRGVGRGHDRHDHEAESAGSQAARHRDWDSRVDESPRSATRGHHRSGDEADASGSHPSRHGDWNSSVGEQHTSTRETGSPHRLGASDWHRDWNGGTARNSDLEENAAYGTRSANWARHEWTGDGSGSYGDEGHQSYYSFGSHDWPGAHMRAHAPHDVQSANDSAAYFDDWVFANPYDQQFWYGVASYLEESPGHKPVPFKELISLSFQAANAMPMALLELDLTREALMPDCQPKEDEIAQRHEMTRPGKD